MISDNTEEVRKVADTILSWKNIKGENTPPAFFCDSDYEFLSGDLKGCSAAKYESDSEIIGLLAKKAADDIRLLNDDANSPSRRFYVGIKVGDDSLLSELNIAFDEILSAAGDSNVYFGVTYDEGDSKNYIGIVICRLYKCTKTSLRVL